MSYPAAPSRDSSRAASAPRPRLSRASSIPPTSKSPSTTRSLGLGPRTLWPTSQELYLIYSALRAGTWSSSSHPLCRSSPSAKLPFSRSIGLHHFVLALWRSPGEVLSNGMTGLPICLLDWLQMPAGAIPTSLFSSPLPVCHKVNVTCIACYSPRTCSNTWEYLLNLSLSRSTYGVWVQSQGVFLSSLAVDPVIQGVACVYFLRLAYCFQRVPTRWCTSFHVSFL